RGGPRHRRALPPDAGGVLVARAAAGRGRLRRFRLPLRARRGAAVRDGEGVAAGAVGRLPPLVVGRRRLPEGDGRRPRARGGAGRGVGRRGDADGAVAARAVRAAEAGSMTVGLVYDRFGDAEPPPGAPPDWDAEYEPERTIAALEGALRHLGHTPVRLGNVPALLTAMQRGP